MTTPRETRRDIADACAALIAADAKRAELEGGER